MRVAARRRAALPRPPARGHRALTVFAGVLRAGPVDAPLTARPAATSAGPPTYRTATPRSATRRCARACCCATRAADRPPPTGWPTWASPAGRPRVRISRGGDAVRPVQWGGDRQPVPDGPERRLGPRRRTGLAQQVRHVHGHRPHRDAERPGDLLVGHPGGQAASTSISRAVSSGSTARRPRRRRPRCGGHRFGGAAPPALTGARPAARSARTGCRRCARQTACDHRPDGSRPAYTWVSIAATSAGRSGPRCWRTAPGAPQSRASVRAASSGRPPRRGGRLVTTSRAGRSGAVASSPIRLRLAGSSACRSSTTSTAGPAPTSARTVRTASRSRASGRVPLARRVRAAGPARPARPAAGQPPVSRPVSTAASQSYGAGPCTRAAPERSPRRARGEGVQGGRDQQALAHARRAGDHRDGRRRRGRRRHAAQARSSSASSPARPTMDTGIISQPYAVVRRDGGRVSWQAAP